MTNPEPTHKQACLNDSDETFRIDNAEIITRGQVTIEKKHRTTYGLDIGDYVDIELYQDETTIHIPDARIGESGRVTIPARQRERYDIIEGDRVDVGVCIQ